MTRIGVAREAGGELLLREQVEEALERLSRLLMRSVGPGGAAESDEIDTMRNAVRFLGQVTSEWATVPPEALLADRAGFGSAVVVEDLDRGTRETYTLMAGPLIDIDQGQVSLASPVGQALLGCRGGDEIVVDTPHRRRRLRVASVRTLQEQIGDEPWRLPAA